MSAEAPAETASRARADTAQSGRGGLRSVATAVRAPVDPPPGKGDVRQQMMLHSVTLTVSDTRCSVTVEVRAGGEQSVAVAEGACAGSGIERLVAEATVRAAGELDPGAHRVGVEAIAVGPVGSRLIATAALVNPIGSGDEALAGAAVVGSSGAVDAVARAVLDALGRRSTFA